MIYADANVIIRLLEGDDATRAPLEARLLPLRGTGRFLLTSRLTRLECRVKPLRANDGALLALYEAFFVGAEVSVIDHNDLSGKFWLQPVGLARNFGFAPKGFAAASEAGSSTSGGIVGGLAWASWR